MSAPIRFEIADRVATLTLDRPDRLNALIPEMQEGFEEALARSAEPDVKVLFLRGAGRAFCAGGDIGWMARTLTEAAGRSWKPSSTWASPWPMAWRPCPSRWSPWCRAPPPVRA